MKAKVSKLSLFGFRGATQPVEINFDTSKPVTLVFGENGTGKSTIADALDFVCNRHFGSLEDRSMSAQPKSHVTSLGQDPKKLKVLLTASVGNFTGTLSKDGPIITPQPAVPTRKFFAGATSCNYWMPNQNKDLRHSKLLLPFPESKIRRTRFA